jgi:hypothetical protein
MWLFNTDPAKADPGYTGPNVTNFADKFANAMKEAMDYGRTQNFFIDVEDKAVKASKTISNGILAQQKVINDAVLKVWKNTQDIGVGTKDIIDFMTSYGNAIGKLPNISAQVAEDVMIFSKATGIAATEMGTYLAKFSEVGIGQKTALEKMEKIYKTARKYGVDATTLTKTVNENLLKASAYGFKNGVEGLTKMAARAQQLGTDFKNIMTIAEKALDPDNAIQMAAEMQMLGGEVGALGDPFQLLYMAQNDIGKLQEEFTKVTESAVDFNSATGEFKIPVQEMYRMRAMAEKLGLNYDQIADAAIKAAKQKEVLSRITLPSSFNEDDKNLVASLAEIKDGRVQIQIPGTDEYIDASNLKEEHLMAIREEAKVNGKTVEQSINQIAQNQLSTADKAQISLNRIENQMIEAYLRQGLQNNILQMLLEETKAVNLARTDKFEPIADQLVPIFDQTMRDIVKTFSDYLTGIEFEEDLNTILGKAGDYKNNSGDVNLDIQFESGGTNTDIVINGDDIFQPAKGGAPTVMGRGQMLQGIPEDEVLMATNITEFLNSSQNAFETLNKINKEGFLSTSQFVFDSLSQMSTNKDMKLFELIAQNLSTPTKPTENLGIDKTNIDKLSSGLSNIVSTTPEIDFDGIMRRSTEKIMEIQNSQNTQTPTQKVEGNVGVDGNVNINVNIPDGYLSTAFSSDRDFQTSIKEQILNVVNYRLSKAYSQGQGNLG